MEYVFIAIAAAVVVSVSLLVYRAVSEAEHEREYQRVDVERDRQPLPRVPAMWREGGWEVSEIRKRIAQEGEYGFGAREGVRRALKVLDECTCGTCASWTGHKPDPTPADRGYCVDDERERVTHADHFCSEWRPEP